MNYLTPTADSLLETSVMMFGDETKVVDCEEAAEPAFVARYVNRRSMGVAICVCDFDFASYSATAFAMVPADSAVEMQKSQALTDEMKGNLGEIMNIYSTLFMNDDTDHLKLLVVETGDFWVIPQPSVQCSFRLEIPGYGGGTLTFSIR